MTASTIRFAIGNGSASLILVSPTIQPNTRYHIVVTLNRTGNMTMYLNGQSVASTNISSWSNVSLTTTNPTLIGKLGGISEPAFSGKIYLVRLFNMSLSQTYINRLYNNGYPEACRITP